jgi:hypothetical protein
MQSIVTTLYAVSESKYRDKCNGNSTETRDSYLIGSFSAELRLAAWPPTGIDAGMEGNGTQRGRDGSPLTRRVSN